MLFLQAVVLFHLANFNQQLSPDDVLSMMARVPAVEGKVNSRTGVFQRSGNAKEVADAIVSVAETYYEAALMVTYAAYESGNARCAVGDGGLSLGTWQMRGLSREVACNPRAAARVWVRRARQAFQDCAENEEAERLAPLLSGSCRVARKKAAGRAAVAALL